MRSHVRDLIGDDRKRAQFSLRAREAVEHRTWSFMVERLLGYYEEAIDVAASERARAA